MNKFTQITSFIIFSLIFQTSFAEVESNQAKYDQLLKILETPQPNYVIKDDDYKIDPKLYKKEYDVTWRVRPKFEISPSEFKQYKSPVKVKMIVVATTGYIADIQILKSSGSNTIDRKVKEALTVARLESIPFVDKSVTYELIHEFDLKNPL